MTPSPRSSRRSTVAPHRGRGTPDAAPEERAATDGHEGIGVLLVDDHQMFNSALSHFLEGDVDIAWVDSATSVEEALDVCRDRRPDVVLIDDDLPERGGIASARLLHREFPDVRVLMLMGSSGPDDLDRALVAGASGSVSKTQGPEELAEVVRRAAAGEVVVRDPDVVGKVRRLGDARRPPVIRSAPIRLTPREVDVLEAFAVGMSTVEAARTLHVSQLTIRSHVKSILAKLGVHSKLEAVTYALRHGLIELPRPA